MYRATTSCGDDARLHRAAKLDSQLTFDEFTDLYHYGTSYEEDQPAHLVIQNTDVCNWPASTSSAAPD